MRDQEDVTEIETTEAQAAAATIASPETMTATTVALVMTAAALNTMIDEIVIIGIGIITVINPATNTAALATVTDMIVTVETDRQDRDDRDCRDRDDRDRRSRDPYFRDYYSRDRYSRDRDSSSEDEHFGGAMKQLKMGQGEKRYKGKK